MFRFKQFSVIQERSPMKVGTDGVLLGAWAGVHPSDLRILDIGTGTGLIALMMAQRAPQALVMGVDIDDVSEARVNADASPWSERVAFAQCPVQEFNADPFDLILSNPPFFADSLTCPLQGRTTARHAVCLRFDELRDAVMRLLAPEGRFAVVVPATETARLSEVFAGHLVLSRCTDVRTVPNRPAKRVLLEFSRPEVQSDCLEEREYTPSVPLCSELTIGTGRHEEYTPEYRALTRDFYLKF